MKLLIFSLGIKGLGVVKALFESSINASISCVIGQDNAVAKDYSVELAAYCNANSIDYCFRDGAGYGSADYDFAIAVGWRWIIQDIPEDRLVVFHDSLLPKYRGFAPLVNALLNKENRVGVSAIFGAKEYDRGNIILQNSMVVVYPTTVGLEIERVSRIYAELAVAAVSKLIDTGGIFPGFPQNEEEASYSLWRDEDDYRINWNDSAIAIEHFINCVGFPYLGAAAKLNKEIVRIFSAKAVDDVKIENRSPGKVIFLRNGFPVVVCGQGLLMIEDGRASDGQPLLPLRSFRSRFL